jgi:hypothetical protein
LHIYRQVDKFVNSGGNRLQVPANKTMMLD